MRPRPVRDLADGRRRFPRRGCELVERQVEDLAEHDPPVPAWGLGASLRSSWIRTGQVHGHAYPIGTRPETRISRGGTQTARC
jgi:hypothetical protein